MCDICEEVREKAWLEGCLEGYMKGRLETQTLQFIANLTKTTGLHFEQVMEALKIPEENRAKYRRAIYE